LSPVPPALTAADAGADSLVGHLVSDDYDRLVASGEITPDAAQRAVAARLDQLLVALSEKRLAAKGSALGWLFGRRKPDPATGVRGLYIWGGVGRGKTMLMDLFFARAPVEKKRRQHFHVFMADVHDRVFAARRQLAAGVDRDPVDIVADQLAPEISLLCFDEFAVTDIADAMILGRLFSKLFDRGVVLVATSNMEPDGLYADGINRAHFLPFIRMLKERTAVVHLGAATDYRMAKLGRAEVYLSPLGRDADVAMDRLWLRLTGSHAGASRTLHVHGRKVPVPMAVGGIARFDFADLCARNLGARDYQAVANAFHTVFLDHVPRLDKERRNEARRFITLVDTLYDAGVKLVVSADAEPGELYRAAHGNEAFEFSRTASRLTEMRSEDYIARPRREVTPPSE
jgi:cell division protein ZapE